MWGGGGGRLEVGLGQTPSPHPSHADQGMGLPWGWVEPSGPVWLSRKGPVLVEWQCKAVVLCIYFLWAGMDAKWSCGAVVSRMEHAPGGG